MKCVWPRIRFPPSGISSGTIFSSINAILLRCAAGRDGGGQFVVRMRIHRRGAETQSKTKSKKGMRGQGGWRVFPGVVESAEEAEGAEKLFFEFSASLCLCGGRSLRMLAAYSF